MKKYIIKIVITAGLLAIAGWLVFEFFLPEYYLPVLPWLLLFFLLASSVIHSWQIKMAKKNLNKFAMTNMMATMIRLFIYSAIVIIYIANKPENAIVFVICMMTFYVVFTFIEVTDLSRLAKKINKK